MARNAEAAGGNEVRLLFIPSEATRGFDVLFMEVFCRPSTHCVLCFVACVFLPSIILAAGVSHGRILTKQIRSRFSLARACSSEDYLCTTCRAEIAPPRPPRGGGQSQGMYRSSEYSLC